MNWIWFMSAQIDQSVKNVCECASFEQEEIKKKNHNSKIYKHSVIYHENKEYILKLNIKTRTETERLINFNPAEIKTEKNKLSSVAWHFGIRCGDLAKGLAGWWGVMVALVPTHSSAVSGWSATTTITTTITLIIFHSCSVHSNLQIDTWRNFTPMIYGYGL